MEDLDIERLANTLNIPLPPNLLSSPPIQPLSRSTSCPNLLPHTDATTTPPAGNTNLPATTHPALPAHLPYDGFYAPSSSESRWNWLPFCRRGRPPNVTDITNEIWQEEFNTRVAQIASPDFYYSQTVRANGAPETVAVNFASLQRFNLHCMQKDLVDIVMRIRAFAQHRTVVKKGERPEELSTRARVLMRDYTTAVRDYDFMQSCALRGQLADPFLLYSSRALDYHLIAEADQGCIPKTLAPPLDRAHPRLPGASRTATNLQSQTKAFLIRLLIALFGGTALIVPMLIMALNKGLNVRLITTSVATFLLALVSAVWVRQTPETLLAGVAAYTAVLVVFVGVGG